MFTGIVEEVGSVRNYKNTSSFTEIEIVCNKVLENTLVGDSIATNGVCLTVKEIKKDSFVADVMGETIERSNLKYLSNNSKVNLERALCIGDRIGGHIVSGHVDGLGKIINIEEKQDGTWFTINAPNEILKYVIFKGSITIEGISLTVAYVDDKKIKVSVIPHTLENTILKYKKNNDFVNLECDMIGKYIEKLCNHKEEKNESNITMDFLIKNGF